MNKSEVYAKHMNARITPKKIAPVMDLVRGKNLKEAKIILSFDKTKGAVLLMKVVKSAEKNAVNNNKLDADKLYVSEIWAGGGQVYKSGQFVAKGRFSPILKRTSNIYVGLSQRNK